MMFTNDCIVLPRASTRGHFTRLIQSEAYARRTLQPQNQHYNSECSERFYKPWPPVTVKTCANITPVLSLRHLPTPAVEDIIYLIIYNDRPKMPILRQNED